MPSFIPRSCNADSGRHSQQETHMGRLPSMSSFDAETDGRLRAAAFAYLDGLAAKGQPLVRQDDLTPFSFDGSPLRLMATQQGIWKPRQLQAALSFRTVFAPDPSQRPYDDEAGARWVSPLQVAGR